MSTIRSCSWRFLWQFWEKKRLDPLEVKTDDAQAMLELL